jgi:hypothetical protein
MKKRKNIRDTFKINDKVDDMYKDQFNITNLEGGTSFSVDYQYYYEGGLVNKTLNSNGITTEYVGVLKPSMMYVEALSVSGFGYSYDLSTLNAAYPASHLGELTPNNNISLFTMGDGIFANIPVFKDIILNVDGSEYYLKYGIDNTFGYNLTNFGFGLQTLTDLEKNYNISYSYVDIISGSTVDFEIIRLINIVSDDNVYYHITSEETAKIALDLVRDGYYGISDLYNTNGEQIPKIGDNILNHGIIRTEWLIYNLSQIIHIVDGYVVDIIEY